MSWRVLHPCRLVGVNNIIPGSIYLIEVDTEKISGKGEEVPLLPWVVTPGALNAFVKF